MEPEKATRCADCGKLIGLDYYRCCGCGRRFCLEDTSEFTEPTFAKKSDRVCDACFGVWLRLCETRKLSHLVGLSEEVQEYVRHLNAPRSGQ